jgi:hypothetical protein
MCEVEPLRYGEILPDWFLCQATKDSEYCGVLVVNKGDWFLARLNSGQASVIWTDEEEKQCVEDYNDYGTCPNELFWCTADTGYLITQSAMKLGFKPGKQNFNIWFLERLIKFKQTATVEYPSKKTYNEPN